MERVLLTAPSFSSVNSELSYLSSDIVNDLTYLVRVFNFIKRKKIRTILLQKKNALCTHWSHFLPCYTERLPAEDASKYYPSLVE